MKYRHTVYTYIYNYMYVGFLSHGGSPVITMLALRRL